MASSDHGRRRLEKAAPEGTTGASGTCDDQLGRRQGDGPLIPPVVAGKPLNCAGVVGLDLFAQLFGLAAQSIEIWALGK
jgi:hypothetical protein